MPSYLITGCSRGLGLELAKQLSTNPSNTIIATSRSSTPTPALQQLIDSSSKRVHFIQLDQDSPTSISSAVSQTSKLLDSTGLQVLINNAATQYPDPDGTPGMTHLSETLQTNVVAIHNVTSAFLPLLRQTPSNQLKKIINISSTLGLMSMAKDFAFAPVASYKVSKAALNMLTVQYALDLEKEEDGEGGGWVVVAVSPGNLRTELGGETAELGVEEGARATLDVIEKVGREESGSFKNIWIEGSENYDGTHRGW